MSHPKRNFSPLPIAALTACLAIGCGDTPSSAASASASAANSAKPTSSAAPPPAASSAAKAPEAPATTGEVETFDKKKIGFSIALPEGLKDVSETPASKEYAKEAKKYDGYRVTIMHEEGKRAGKAAFDELLKVAEKQGKVLKSESRDDAWTIAVAVDEGGRKAVVLQSVVSKGTTHLFCKGGAEGTFEQTAAVEALTAACGSLKITSP